MSKKPGWVWKAYFLIYLAIITANTAYFFTADSFINLYYQTLMALDFHFVLPYCLNALVIILNGFAVFFLYLFVRGEYGFSRIFSYWFISFRLVADLTGHSFEGQVIKAEFSQEPIYGIILVSLLALISLPSYLALYVCARRRD